MNKPWLGYLGSFLMLLGGALMIVAQSYLMGIVLILAAIASAVLKYIIGKKKQD
ncbi:MAG: hypothetical protein JNJ41_06600 [Bacteroidia bacterium]|nr:hypothetical protein [Bacteroidia bacterium]